MTQSPEKLRNFVNANAYPCRFFPPNVFQQDKSHVRQYSYSYATALFLLCMFVVG